MCFSMGRASRFSVSSGPAPGSTAITSIIGTEICGSSSRGVATMASAPTPSDAMVKSGVSLERRNALAMRPEAPTSTWPLLRER